MTDASESDQDAAVAAALPFLEAFDLPEKEMARRLYPAFVKAFKGSYKPPNLRHVLLVRWTPENLAKWASDLADAALYNLRLIQNAKPDMPLLEQAVRYGGALGDILHAIEFKIADKNYDSQINGAALYSKFKEIAVILHAQGKRIRPDFIQKRIDRIGQEKAELLSADTKVLLAKIASLFAQ